MAGELEDRWVLAGGTPVFLRIAEPSPDAPAVLHLHGFAISGRYLLPTAAEMQGMFGVSGSVLRMTDEGLLFESAWEMPAP